jgi:hypothetical protein
MAFKWDRIRILEWPPAPEMPNSGSPVRQENLRENYYNPVDEMKASADRACPERLSAGKESNGRERE